MNYFMVFSMNKVKAEHLFLMRLKHMYSELLQKIG